MNSSAPSKSASAFTLVELLVVISIIGLLAGLAIPAISSGMAKAKMAGSTSNLRQIGIGILGYCAENSMTFPNASGGTVDGKAYGNWAGLLLPYIKVDLSKKNTVFVSPACLKPVTAGSGTDIALSYGVHNGLMPKTGTPKTMLNVTRASDCIMVGDTCQDPGNKGWSPFCIESPSIINTQSAGGRGGGSTDLSAKIDTGTDSDTGNSPTLRYRNSGNRVAVVMCDGHAETIKKGEAKNGHFVY